MSDPRVRCTRVASPRGARETTFTWADGHASVLPHRLLRGFCPCAGCQGHEGDVRFVEPSGDAALELDGIEPVGSYALRLVWFDGHGSGLYSFAYLRSLCPCATCRPDGPPEGVVRRL